MAGHGDLKQGPKGHSATGRPHPTFDTVALQRSGPLVALAGHTSSRTARIIEMGWHDL